MTTQKERFQDYFNRAYTGLAKQDWKQSKYPAEFVACKYRGPDGLKCAVGHLVDDKQAAVMEHYGVIDKVPRQHNPFPEEDLAFLKGLQIRHDFGSPVKGRQGMMFGYIKDAFIAFAANNGLTIPELDNT